LGGCTSGSQSAVTAKLPATIGVAAFLFFETDFKSCTFAELSTVAGIRIEETRFSSSAAALRDVSSENSFSTLKFPKDGFHYFKGYSIADLAWTVRSNGDEDLAFQLEESIFNAKRCWRRGLEPSSPDISRYTNLILDNEAIIAIGAESPNTVILLYPDQRRAYYFGP